MKSNFCASYYDIGVQDKFSLFRSPLKSDNQTWVKDAIGEP